MRLADAARTVNEHFVKAPARWPAVGLIAKMPFAKDAGGVACRLEHVGEGDRGWRQSFSFERRVRDAATELMPAGEKRGARGGASGAHMEVGEAHALSMKLIDV